MRWTMSAALLMLAACSGGQDEESGPEASSNIGAPQQAEHPVPAETPVTDQAPAPAGTDAEVDNKTIPPAIRGRWALDPADCPKRPGTDLTVLTVEAADLRFHESHGELARVRESDSRHIVADYRFSGEGEEWDRRMQLDLADGGKVLVRRDMGEGAAAGAMRYTRCAG